MRGQAGPVRRPQLSDLRESGSIEEDADLVLFVSHDDTPEATAGDPLAEITIGKQRNGMTGNFQLFFRKRITKFSDLHKESY